MPPEGYREPVTVWSVEFIDPRQPNEGSVQVGAFTSEKEAEALRQRLEDEGSLPPLRINLIPVHRRVEDWEWDR